MSDYTTMRILIALLMGMSLVSGTWGLVLAKRVGESKVREGSFDLPRPLTNYDIGDATTMRERVGTLEQRYWQHSPAGVPEVLATIVPGETFTIHKADGKQITLRLLETGGYEVVPSVYGTYGDGSIPTKGGGK